MKLINTMKNQVIFFDDLVRGGVSIRKKHWSSNIFSIKIILPRDLCFYHKVSSEKIPFYKIKNFAEIQARSHSPFSNFGLFSLKQGKWLHIWMWDKKIEDDIEYFLGGGQLFQIYPSSLTACQKENGVYFINSAINNNSLEAQLWKNKLLVDTMCLNAPPTAASWFNVLNEDPQLISTGWPLELDQTNLLERSLLTWGRNLTPREAGRIRIQWPFLFDLSLLIITVFFMAWAVMIFSEKRTLEALIEDKVNVRVKTVESLEPLLEKRLRVEAVNTWLAQANELYINPSMDQILNDFSDFMPRYDLVFREIDISPPTIQAVFVAKKGDINLTNILEYIENNEYYYDARFVDTVGNDGYKVTWRIKSRIPVRDNNDQ